MINSRALFIIFVMLVFFMILTAKLFEIQISEHDDYNFFAKNQQIRIKVINAERGMIYDRNAELLAYDRNDISFYADVNLLKKNKKNFQTVIDTFAIVFRKTKQYYSSLLKQSKKIICIEKKVLRENAVKLKDLVIDGLIIEEDPTRVYSYDNLASHVLGYVGEGYKGIEGIEKYYNKVLTGSDGKMLIERDVKGRMITVKEEETIPPKPGNSLILTIDKSYQKILEEELLSGLNQFKSVSAMGIIMDPNNGEILALANIPDFNPNRYWQYADDVRRNKILTDTYEPGSTFKAITLSALLDQNLCNLNEEIYTENGDYIFKRVHIRDTHKFEKLSVTKVFEQSSNIGMAKLSQRISENILYKYLRNFGIGNYGFIDLPGEDKGRLKKPDEFGAFTKPFLSFGYQVSLTPLQLISAYATLINGGNLYQPHILKQVKTRNGNLIEKIEPKLLRNVISKETSLKMKRLFRGVVENGTGKTAGLKNISVGGKTGTSQQLVDNKYSKQNYNSSFVGFFPVDNPKVLCLILLNSPQIGRYGGLAAAPIFKKVAERLVETDINLIRSSEVKSQEKVFDEIFTSLDSGNGLYSNLPENHYEKSKKVTIKNRNVMPNLQEMSLKDAITVLTELGMKYRVIGNGKIIEQSIKPGEKINSGLVCFLKCEEKRISGISIN